MREKFGASRGGRNGPKCAILFTWGQLYVPHNSMNTLFTLSLSLRIFPTLKWKIKRFSRKKRYACDLGKSLLVFANSPERAPRVRQSEEMNGLVMFPLFFPSYPPHPLSNGWEECGDKVPQLSTFPSVSQFSTLLFFFR